MVIQGEAGLILLGVMSHRKLDGMLANTVYIHLELCTGDCSFHLALGDRVKSYDGDCYMQIW